MNRQSLKIIFPSDRAEKLDRLDTAYLLTNSMDLQNLNRVKNTTSEMQMRDVASILRNGYDENHVEVCEN